MKFVSLKTLTQNQNAPFFMTLSITKRSNFMFSTSVARYLRKYHRCMGVLVSEDKTVLRVYSSEVGLNPSADKLTLHNVALHKLLVDRFPNVNKMTFVGEKNDKEQCIDFNISQLA